MKKLLATRTWIITISVFPFVPAVHSAILTIGNIAQFYNTF